MQAPKKRTGHRRDKDAPRRRLPLLAGAVGAIAALAAVVGVAFVMGGSSTGVADTMRGAGCTYREVEASQNLPNAELRHLTELPKGFKYNTEPPTSGYHNPQTIVWGFYDEPVARLRTVHNLEHGGIVIHYGRRVSDSVVAQLNQFWRDDPNGIVVAPLPSLGNRMSLAAWTFDQGRLVERAYQGEGRLALCTNFDEGAFRDFVDEYRGRGPEPFPVGQLTPGNP